MLTLIDVLKEQMGQQGTLPLVKIGGIRLFYYVIKKEFPHVRRPNNFDLSVCSICDELTTLQERYYACNSLELLETILFVCLLSDYNISADLRLMPIRLHIKKNDWNIRNGESMLGTIQTRFAFSLKMEWGTRRSCLQEGTEHYLMR